MNTQRVEGRGERGEGGRFGIWDLGFGIPRAPSPDPRTPPPHARRGVLLLVVLAILALFALIAVAFVVLSGQAQRSAKSIERFEQVIDPPDKLLHQAAMQVFRGPTTNYATGLLDQSSVMQAHSLLEDIYGNESVYGTIQTSLPASGGGFPQLVDVTVSALFNADGTASTNVTAELASRVGCVLTITGPLPTTPGYGQSTRIVAANTGSPIVQVVAFPNNAVPPLGTEFTINGVPFSGTGFGYDSNDHDLDLAYDPTLGAEKLSAPVVGTTWPVALLPNLPLSIYSDPTANPAPSFVFGGANEDYDAADFQNMLLAAQVPIHGDPANPALVTSVQTLPSLHRPALVRYWADQLGISATGWDNTNIGLLRSIMLRPIGGQPWTDHPNFTGSNPNFNPAWNMIDQDGSRWDVDNDGDGVADSVWVDLGMPVRATTDGRLYKPLFAILCVDLDGRLNLNAHGSLPQTDAVNYNIPIPRAGGMFVGGAGMPSARGQGLGPADINLRYLIGDPYSRNVMSGIPGSYQGRYGTDGLLGTNWPGTAALDPLSANKWFEYAGQNYWDFMLANNAGSYGSPPDPFGVGAVGLDPAGRPLYVGMNYGGTDYVGYGGGVTNSPYELNLDPNQTRGVPSSIATVDNPFSPAELERILRPFDRDAPSLPDRLAQLSAAMPGDTKTSVLYNVRHSLTTESWDLPCPNVVTPSSLTAAERTAIGGRVKHITDLLLARGVPATAWAKLLPADLLAGLRMNINRPFGNGLDDDTDGVVDEQWPPETETLTLNSNGPVTVPFSYDGSNMLVTNSLEARQLEARFLYVLAMLVADTDAIKNRFGWTNEELARFLAQWAVNAVDFKDRDSIMTPFKYDPAPLTAAGWQANNDLTTDTTHIVWGCERPELLISETLAFHDRRTEDTADDLTLKDTQDTVDPDNDFDQKIKPQGSLFVELYNPWSMREPHSRDFYNSTQSDGGVDIGRLAGNYPVWRLAIVNSSHSSTDPDDPTLASAVPVERAVYFNGAATVTLPGDCSDNYQPDATYSTQIAPVLPGRYAVIGPGNPADSGSAETYIGFRTGTSAGDNQTRRIVLTPDTDPDQQQVQVFNYDGTPPANDLLGLSIQPAAAVVVNSPRLSISEPVTGYPDYTSGDGTSYDPPEDEPLDQSGPLVDEIRDTDTHPNVRIIYLQRLANPLLPYDAQTNPYRTIDSMSVNLTSFNGVTSSPTDPLDSGNELTTKFYTRERGENNGTTATESNLWRREPYGDPTDSNGTLADATNHHFNRPLHHTLGYLNFPFGTPSSTAGYIGDPQLPFSWLTWNNRPYVSPLELMQVSWLRSSKLLGKYNMAQGGDDPYTEPSQPFPHLTNFFLSGTPSSPDEELHRVFEYLGVPSPFVGTETQANPSAANSAGHNFRPPFNGISAYREPGRVNLNTIYSEGVFNGLKNGSLPNVTWQNFVRSRRGYPALPLQEDVVLAPDPHSDPTKPLFPTEFGKPFRSFGGAAMVPTLDPAHDVLKYDCEIDATLLREGSTSGSPLFQYSSNNPVDNTNRNPYFRYQGIQRLGNLVTTRSNVYAVWITVGYFEVTPIAPDAMHPDGYTLGRELGMDTGEIERHRAFYIFDRSIPVGFQRGQDLNVEKAILVDRFIE